MSRSHCPPVTDRAAQRSRSEPSARSARTRSRCRRPAARRSANRCREASTASTSRHRRASPTARRRRRSRRSRRRTAARPIRRDHQVESFSVGAGTPDHVRPPSVVRTIDVHTGLAHGALPRTQPSAAEMKLTDAGWKPDGTGPPAGAAAAGPAAKTPTRHAATTLTTPASTIRLADDVVVSGRGRGSHRR